jgi:hypothetical protein
MDILERRIDERLNQIFKFKRWATGIVVAYARSATKKKHTPMHLPQKL